MNRESPLPTNILSFSLTCFEILYSFALNQYFGYVLKFLFTKVVNRFTDKTNAVTLDKRVCQMQKCKLKLACAKA